MPYSFLSGILLIIGNVRRRAGAHPKINVGSRLE